MVVQLLFFAVAYELIFQTSESGGSKRRSKSRKIGEAAEVRMKTVALKLASNIFIVARLNDNASDQLQLIVAFG